MSLTFKGGTAWRDGVYLARITGLGAVVGLRRVSLPSMAEEQGTFTCGRRVEAGMDREDSPLRRSGKGLDRWREWPEEPGRMYCSYCGSMPSEALFEAIERGEQLTPTDKDYKVYVEPGSRKFYFQHFTDEEKRRFVDLLNARAIKIAYPGYFYRLPYFVA